jgi:hypothetical protein
LFGLIVEISTTGQAKSYKQNRKFYSQYTFSIGLTGLEIIERRIENTGIVISSLFIEKSIHNIKSRSSNNNDNKYEIKIDIFRIASTPSIMQQ